MRIIRDPKRLNPCVLVLGMFDGVHRGHQALLMRGDELAQEMVYPLAVCTFQPHPLHVLAPEKEPVMLTTLPEKAAVMQSFGVDGLCVTTFTRARANQSPEDFMAELVEVYAPVVIVCGFNFTFGAGGKGNGQMLKEYGKKHGFRTVIVPEVVIDGETVSSTRIRRLLAQGDMHEVNNLLGRGYSIAGRVEEGKQVGRTIGFPTANITIPPHKALPAFGVYACYLETSGGIFPAVVNVGRHPTLPEGHVTVEAHVLDEFLSLYGRNVRLTFLKFMRPEQKFDSIETLRAQKEQLEYAKSASSDAATALRLDTDIREQIISVRAAYESGAYSSLDTLIPQLKTTVLKREYAYNGSDDLTAKLDELNAQITALSGAASGGTTRITAPVSGTYSAVADGYESVLTPEALETMTPSQLSSAAPQSVSTTVGKLIQGSAWYFAANVNEEDAASLKENSRLTLRMASGVGFDLPVTLTRISAAENGKCLIVLKSTRYLSYMTLLREQNAELIISAYDGLRVPKNALRVDENGVSGVYCLVGRVAYFKPVSIVYQGSDYCLVEPGTIEAATESQKSLYTLRPNDEVIVSAGELYNGKVVD